MRRHVLVLLLATYLATAAGYLPSIDDEIVVRVTQSMVEDRSLAITPLSLFPDFAVAQGRDGRQYASKGLGLSLVALPPYLAGQWLAPPEGVVRLPQQGEGVPAQVSRFLISFVNALIVALSGALLYSVCGLLGYGRRTALAITLLFGFGTMAWVYASRSFFPEPMLGLSLLLAFYGVVRWQRGGGHWWLFLAGLSLGWAALVKVTVLAAIPCFLWYVAVDRHLLSWRTRVRELSAMLAPLAAAGLLLAAYNYYRFGSLFESGYGLEGGKSGDLQLFTAVPEAIYGLLLSPGKGLIIYALPIVLVPLAWRPFWNGHRREMLLILAVALSFLLTSVAWYDWAGGWSWGPRFLLPVVPLLLVPLGALPVSRLRVAFVAGLFGAAIQLPGVLVNWGWWYSEAMAKGAAAFRDHPEPLVFFDPSWWPVAGQARLLLERGADIVWLRAGQYFPDLAWLPMFGVLFVAIALNSAVRLGRLALTVEEVRSVGLRLDCIRQLIAWKPRFVLAAIVLVYLILSLTYSRLNPVFEAPDELWHYLYVHHLQTERALPIQDAARPEVGPRQEGSQPPMYYALAALVGRPTRPDDLSAYRELNFRHHMGEVFSPDERNVVYHTDNESESPTARAVHSIRLLSVLLGACTLLVVYALARHCLPKSPGAALAATGLVGLLPQFVFLSSAVNNDNMAIVLASLCLLLLLRARERPSPRRLLLLGLACGLAALSKLSAVGLLAVIAAGLIVRWRDGSPVGAATRLIVVFGTASVVAGWWYARNVLLYGDPLGLNVMLAMVGRRETFPDLSTLLDELWQIKASFWTLFGWTNVPADGWYYLLTDALMLIAAACFVRAWLKKRSSRPREMWLLGLWVVVAFASLANWERLTFAPQGRLLFSALAPLAILAVWGLGTLRAGRWPPAWLAGPLLMAGLTVYALLAYLLPSYPILPVIAAVRLPAETVAIDIDFGPYLLIGLRLPSGDLHPGDSVAVSLYWRRDDGRAPALTRFLHLERPGELVAGQDVALPLEIPEPVWSSKDVWRDEARLVVPHAARVPVVVDLNVGLYQSGDGKRLRGLDRGSGYAGDAMSLGRIRIVSPSAGGMPAGEVRREEFGGEIALDAIQLDRVVQAGQALRGRLSWRAIEAPRKDYTVFVQVLGEAGVVAQFDGQPLGGRYPTSVWMPGDRVDDELTIDLTGLAPGDYRLIAGLYDQASGRRLPVGAGDYADLGAVRVAARS